MKQKCAFAIRSDVNVYVNDEWISIDKIKQPIQYVRECNEVEYFNFFYYFFAGSPLAKTKEIHWD